MASDGRSDPANSRLSDAQSAKNSTKKSFAEYYREYRNRKEAKLDNFSRYVSERRKTAAEYQHEYRVRKEAEKQKQSEKDSRLPDSINIDPHTTTRVSTSANKSRTANSSASDSKMASNAKKRAKPSAEKQQDYRARKKAKSGNISENSETTTVATMAPSTTAHSHTNDGPSTSPVTVPKEPRREKSPVEYQRRYPERLKSKRLNDSSKSTSGGSTTSAKPSSTVTERTKDRTNANIEDATRDDIPENKKIDDTRTDHDTRSNLKQPLTNHSSSKGRVIKPKKRRRRKSAAEYKRDYRQRLKSGRVNNSSSATSGRSTTSSKSSTITERTKDRTNVNIEEATSDNIPRNKGNDDARVDHDTQIDLKLPLTNPNPPRNRVIIPDKSRRGKPAAQYQRESRERLKSRYPNSSLNSTSAKSSTITEKTKDRTNVNIKDATRGNIPRNKTIDDTRTDHETYSNLKPLPTNHSTSRSGIMIPNRARRRKPAAQYQRQRLKSRCPNNSSNSANSSNPSSDINDDLLSAIAKSREDVMLNEELFEFLRETNDLQRSISLEIIDHLTGDQLQPLRVFLTGAPGRGKTFVIRLILQLYHKYATTNVHCNAYLICALTGKAAVAINGPTVHTALSLSTGVGSGLSAEVLHQFRSLFEHIRVVIIDEVSSVGAELLGQLDRRLRLITGRSDVPFGGLDVILIGDSGQPPPVKRSKDSIDSRTWRSFKFHEVTEVVCQSNALFSALLAKIANGDQLSKEETTLLESTFVTEEEANRLCPHGLRLAYFNKTVDVYDRLILKNEQEKIASEAVDFILGCETDEEQESACRALENRQWAAETGGLPQSLTFVVGKYYTITTDVAVDDGLAKGTMGKLAHIERSDTGEVTRVWLLFPACETIGMKSRSAMSAFMTANDIDPLAVPIDRCVETFYLNREETISVKRHHFPLAPGFSLKIKRSQIGSFDEVVYYYDKSQSKELVYAAMSRITSIEGLYIVPVNKQTEFYHGEASNDCSYGVSQNEMTRLHRTTLDLLKQELLQPVDSKSDLSLV